MNLIHLKYFMTLAQKEHVQETAKVLHVSPSGISSSIKKLEEELGAKLFDRIGRNMQLNDSGKTFLPYVEKVFETLEQGQSAVEEASSIQEKRVKFSVKDATFWNVFFSQFNEEYPDVYICQHDIDPEFDGKLLDEMNLDFMITDKPLTNSTLESRIIFENKYILLVSNKHPLAKTGRHSCSLLELQNETFLVRHESDYIQQNTDELFSNHGFNPQKSMEFEYMLRAIMLEKNVGVIIDAEVTAFSDIYKNTTPIQIKEFENFLFPKMIYWKRNAHLSEGACKFKDFLIKAGKELQLQLIHNRK